MKYALFFFLFSTGNLQAKNLLVASNIELKKEERLESISFVHNAKTNRAAIEVSISYPLYAHASEWEDFRSREIRFLVDSLSYDAGKKVIIYTSGTKKYVCAKLKKRLGLLPYMKQTGACHLTYSRKEVERDDGWDLYSLSLIDVYFSVL